jgi:hypothetical protein
MHVHASLITLIAMSLFVDPGVVAAPVPASAAAPAVAPAVTPPPESFFLMVDEPDRAVARSFYRKYIDVGGLPVVAAAVVADEALHRTHEIVSRMLAGRPDVLRAMAFKSMYLIIIGKDQVYTDMPEYRNDPNPAYVNERVRGTGGRPTSFGEENLLSLPLDRYDDESIAVHEFCHTIDSTLAGMDPGWEDRLERAYRTAMDKGLWRLTYAASNAGEFWAEICQAYFDCNRVNNWNHGPIGTREQLQAFDPESYELVRTTFNLRADQDWRYAWKQPLPNVTAPPARFGVDPYYTQFTWAREFTVLGRGATEEALLKANDTIRKMFAYRHDILKALINDGVRLVVLGRGERLADLPEAQALAARPGFDPLARFLDYTPEAKLLVVSEENVLGNPDDPRVGDAQVIRVMARAAYRVTAGRPVDPLWESRGREVQQYELRVQRLDVRFDDSLKRAFAEARTAGKWKGTAAVHEAEAYWTQGVLAWFDACGQGAAPPDADFPIATREALRDYDPGLFRLVQETMAYAGHVDWRYPRP